MCQKLMVCEWWSVKLRRRSPGRPNIEIKMNLDYENDLCGTNHHINRIRRSNTNAVGVLVRIMRLTATHCCHSTVARTIRTDERKIHSNLSNDLFFACHDVGTAAAGARSLCVAEQVSRNGMSLRWNGVNSKFHMCSYSCTSFRRTRQPCRRTVLSSSKMSECGGVQPIKEFTLFGATFVWFRFIVKISLVPLLMSKVRVKLNVSHFCSKTDECFECNANGSDLRRRTFIKHYILFVVHMWSFEARPRGRAVAEDWKMTETRMVMALCSDNVEEQMCENCKLRYDSSRA